MAVALATGAGSLLALNTPAASAASLWYVEAGATSTACTQAAPCGAVSRALSLAADGDTVKVGAGTYTGSISVPSGLSVTIDGAGAKSTIFDGNKSGRVITIPLSASATLSNLTLTNGSTAGYGGGAYAEGALTLDKVDITSNTTTLSGGGVYAGPSATLTISDSLISGNKAALWGGGIHVGGKSAVLRGVTVSGNTSTGFGSANGGGGISTAGSLDLENVTITGNKATAAYAQGGGIFYVAVLSSGAKLTARHLTLAGNSAATGGGIASPGSRTADVAASIIAGNTAGSGAGCSGIDITGARNVTDDGGTSCGLATAENDVLGADPQLGALADNGGPTATRAIPATSPAHDAVPADTGLCSGNDQRGTLRLHLYLTACDAGAYQYVAAAPHASVSPSSVAFGDQTAGTTATRTVTLTNTGVRPLGLNGATVTGSGFRLDSTTCQVGGQPVPLGPNAACQITVAFAPALPGPRLGALTLTDNDGETQDPGGSTQTITLTGNGTLVASPTPTPTDPGSPTPDPTPTDPTPTPGTGTAPSVGWVAPLTVGFATKGGLLVGMPGMWNGTSPVTFAAQWQRCDAAGAGCTAIDGATSWTYTPGTADVGGRLRLQVVATNPAGTATAYSQVTDVIR